MANHLDKATLAGGCFWCTEALFERLKGVESVESGYSGGDTDNPTYEDVSAGSSGHAEAIQIVFDPSVLAYQELLEVFFATHDPTTLNQQGADNGPQYRSAIFYHSDEQRVIAERMRDDLDASGKFSDPIVTQIEPFREFYPAEAEHQQFFQNNPTQGYCQVVIDPKVQKLITQFPDKIAD